MGYYDTILTLIVEKKYYCYISGCTRAGAELILEKHDGIYKQGKIVFTAEMVNVIKFVDTGAVVILKH